MSHPGLGYSAWHTRPTLPDVCRLYRVNKLPGPFLDVFAGAAALCSSRFACLESSIVSSNENMGGISPTSSLGQVRLGISPFIVLGLDFLKGNIRVVGTLFGVIEEDRSGVVRGRGASSSLDQFWGGVSGVVRSGSRVIVRPERSFHSVKLCSEVIDGKVIKVKIKRCGSELGYELGQAPRGLTAGEAGGF